MVAMRRWSAEEFRDLFITHPLVWHIARRLVWLAEGEGAPAAFRVAEDRTFADVHDDAFAPPATAAIGIAHPLHLGADLPAWRRTRLDNEILQPFLQIERPTYALGQEELGGGGLARFEGVTARTVRLLALKHRGWGRAGYGDISRALPGGRRVTVQLRPGLAFADPDEDPEQTLGAVRLDGGTFGELHPVTASEVLADLTGLTGASREDR